MLTIYGVYRSRASRNFWLANELGLPFRHVPVIQANRLPEPDAPDAPLNSKSAAFVAINPNGKIPSIDDDGLVLHESLAINLYLARKHGGPLAPADLAEEAQMTMWSLWAATAVEPHALTVLQRAVGDASRAAAEASLLAPFAALDGHLRTAGHLVGNRFTVADINVAEVIRYATGATALFDAAPHVKGWLEACQARSAHVEMARVRALEPA